MPKVDIERWGAVIASVLAMLTSFGGIVAVAARNDTLLKQQVERVEKVERKNEQQDQKLELIAPDIATIRNDVSWIKQRLGGAK